MKALPFDVFSTCPPSHGTGGSAYTRRIAEVARWSEAWGYTGILVYTDNSLLDPWLVAHLIVQNTERLSPLVAVQPVYMHPYAVAKLVTSFADLHGRRLYLNMVAGGFTNDLVALNDGTPHDRRYDRLVEYTRVITDLLATAGPVSFEGEFYLIDKVRLTPPLPRALIPGVFVSGSSEAGLAARASTEEAWATAHARFPEDRRGQLTHQLAMKTSDSVWHRELSERDRAQEESPYWLVPFQNYKTFCPYLVGSYERVGEELARYRGLGYRTLILDVPVDDAECEHIDHSLTHATEIARCPSYSSIG